MPLLRLDNVSPAYGHLAKLRAADVVRYEAAGGRIRYRLKHPKEMREIFSALR